jgi:glutaredoxin
VYKPKKKKKKKRALRKKGKKMITVFVLDGCPYCERAIKALHAEKARSKLGFGVVSVNRTPDLREKLRLRTGVSSFPSVWFGGVYIGGLETGPEPFGGLLRVLETGSWSKARSNEAYHSPIMK